MYGSSRGLSRMYDPTLPHQDYPQDFSTPYNYKITQLFNEDKKFLMDFNTPATLHKVIVHNQ